MRIVLMAAVIALSTPAFASGSDTRPAPTNVDGPQQAQQNSATEDSGDKKICKRVQATESRLGVKKVCLTAQQWKDRDEENSSAY